MTTVPTRLIELEGCFNFRDLGGYLGADGRGVRWRTLFRADGLYRLTPADLELLAELGLRTVIDLRTGDEVTNRGRIAWPTDGLVYHHLPMMDVLPQRNAYTAWADPVHVARQYLDMLASGHRAVAGALEVLADPASYPAVAHCMAGKDRTGTLAALVLGLVGVADEDIVADYALSQDGMRRMLDWLRSTYPEQADDWTASAAAIVAAAPETMATFLTEFRRRHGDFDAYATSLGVPGAAAALRANLLAP